ncbi:PINIT domain-containing protein [Amylocarpus encephaloides]|uniref:PINIT domain-containing protein n=1 Tax=Amylocarpus encephaloides TaxID=45428 RepID=A0A9P7YKG5_9HELO|nr:PINIT domain-containing protein [Amylocarpus encephaloides]
MASMGRSGYIDPEPLIRAIKGSGLLNKTLSAICSAEGLSKNGVKSELMSRLIERMLCRWSAALPSLTSPPSLSSLTFNPFLPLGMLLYSNYIITKTNFTTLGVRTYAGQRDYEKFERLQSLIRAPPAGGLAHPGMANSNSPARSIPPNLSLVYPPQAASPANGYNMGGGANDYRQYGQQALEFKPSPFYRVEQQIGEITSCEVMEAHRHTVKITLRASEHPVLGRVRTDPSLRIMVFCAGDDKGRQEIVFPHQSEIKVNTGEVKANLRGLKNKPGSTRPVDITKELRLNPATYSNVVEMTYALTSKASCDSQKYYLVVYVVKTVPVPELVEVLTNGKRITEQSVLDDMAVKSRDPDIVATASVLSLKCPLSTLRIDLPCRSMACRHNQCFDAKSYLQLQEQGPTWLCPICNSSAPFETLAVDNYVRNILKSTSKSIDQVTVQPNGQWETHTRAEPTNSRTNGVPSDDDDDDDDLVEIVKSGDTFKMGTPRAYGTAQRSALVASGSPKDHGSASAKRPIAAVIDLTSSGDEDEKPLSRSRTPKRQQTNGYSGSPAVPVFRPQPSNGYRL